MAARRGAIRRVGRKQRRHPPASRRSRPRGQAASAGGDPVAHPGQAEADPCRSRRRPWCWPTSWASWRPKAAA